VLISPLRKANLGIGRGLASVLLKANWAVRTRHIDEEARMGILPSLPKFIIMIAVATKYFRAIRLEHTGS
jgi:hypothetical protein